MIQHPGGPSFHWIPAPHPQTLALACTLVCVPSPLLWVLRLGFPAGSCRAPVRVLFTRVERAGWRVGSLEPRVPLGQGVGAVTEQEPSHAGCSGSMDRAGGWIWSRLGGGEGGTEGSVWAEVIAGAWPGAAGKAGRKERPFRQPAHPGSWGSIRQTRRQDQMAPRQE